MNTDNLKKGQKVIIRRNGHETEATVARDTPYKEEFPFVLVTIDDSNLLVHRAQIQ